MGKSEGGYCHKLGAHKPPLIIAITSLNSTGYVRILGWIYIQPFIFPLFPIESAHQVYIYNPYKKVYMVKYTTIRVKEPLRDWLNDEVKKRKLDSVEELIEYFRNKPKDTRKQIVLDLSGDTYYAYHEVTKILHEMKLLAKPDISDAIALAMTSIQQGITKSMETSQKNALPSGGMSGTEVGKAMLPVSGGQIP